ncbi:TldD/PmbA family protein [bacterium]|nr:TldD/PmbA family protein [bacterium]
MMNKDIFTKDRDFELIQYYRKSSDVSFVDKQLKQNKTTEYEGKALRIIKNKRLALVSGTRNIPDDILIKKAENALPFASEVKFSFHDFDRFNQENGTLYKKDDEISPENAIKVGNAILDKLTKLHEFKDFSFNISFGCGKEEINIKNSSFSEKEFDRSWSGMGLAAKRIGQDDILILYFVAHDPLRIENIETWLQDVEFYKSIELSKNIVSLEGGNYPVIFHPDALMYMMISLNDGLSMKNVYEKISPIKDKMNQMILNERITIIDDPFFEKGVKRSLFDDEGVPCSKKNVIENGILKHFYTDLDYAAKCNVEPSGNGFKESLISDSKLMGNPPAIMPTNLHILADSKGPSIGEMLKDIKTGFLIESCPDTWMGNIVSGDIGGNITLGYKIENGKLTGRVKNKRFAGNIYKLLGSQLVALSNKEKVAINGADRFPYIMLKDVSIT